MTTIATVLALLASCALAPGPGGRPAKPQETHCTPADLDNSRFSPVISLVAVLQSEGGSAGGREEFVSRMKHGRDYPFAIWVGAGAAALLPGKAGRRIEGPPARPAPSIDATHAAGLAAALGCRMSIRNGLSVQASLGVERHSGRTIEDGSFGTVEFGDMTVFPVLFGLRVHLPLHTETSTWFRQDFSPAQKGFNPFVALMVGAAHRNPVSASGAGYWEAATVFSARVELGVSYGFGFLSVEASVSMAYHSEPPEAVWFAESEAATAISLGGALCASF